MVVPPSNRIGTAPRRSSGPQRTFHPGSARRAGGRRQDGRPPMHVFGLDGDFRWTRAVSTQGVEASPSIRCFRCGVHIASPSSIGFLPITDGSSTRHPNPNAGAQKTSPLSQSTSPPLYPPRQRLSFRYPTPSPVQMRQGTQTFLHRSFSPTPSSPTTSVIPPFPSLPRRSMHVLTDIDSHFPSRAPACAMVNVYVLYDALLRLEDRSAAAPRMG